MKKTLLIAAAVVLALAALWAGNAVAQGSQPPSGMPFGMMMGGGRGWMHDYVEKALAEKLGMTEQQVEDALASGKTMYQIALETGTVEADIPALMTEVHKAAFAAAVKDGVLTQAQADAMLERMQSNWGNGFSGNCPMQGGGRGPGNGTGFRGGMMRQW